MPSRPVILATSLLSVAAAAAALDLVRAVRRFEPAAVGQDAVSRQLAKFARLRADLPRAAVLRVVGDTRELDPGLSAVADRLTEAIRQQLRTGGFDAMPADVRPFVEHVAAGYLERYPDARGHGLPELRENLLAWWGGLVGGLHLAQMR